MTVCNAGTNALNIGATAAPTAFFKYRNEDARESIVLAKFEASALPNATEY